MTPEDVPWRRRRRTLVLAAVFFLLFPAFRSAQMRLPDALEAAEAMTVAGHNPRTWNKPLSFGPYRTLSVREGSEFSWTVEIFGVGGGAAKKVYRMVLEGPDAETWEVECRARAIEVWRGSWSVVLTDAFKPRLACAAHAAERRESLRLMLGSRGRELRGAIQDAASGATHFELRSTHRLAGSKISTPEPVGFLLEREGAAAAAVETVNRGRVWLDSALAPEDRGRAAVAAVALLLFDPEQSPVD